MFIVINKNLGSSRRKWVPISFYQPPPKERGNGTAVASERTLGCQLSTISIEIGNGCLTLMFFNHLLAYRTLSRLFSSTWRLNGFVPKNLTQDLYCYQ